MNLTLQHQQRLAVVNVVSYQSDQRVVTTREISEVALWFLSIWWLVQIGLMARQLIVTSHQVSYQISLIMTSFLVALVVGFVSWKLSRYENSPS